MSSSDSKLVVPEISEGSSVPELMTFVRSSFRQEEFDKVKGLLVGREEKLKMELRNLTRIYEEVKKECESLEEKNGVLEVENLEIMEELKKCRLECEESRQKLISLDDEKNRIIEELMREKREAEEMVALRDGQLMDYNIRVFNLEEAAAQIMRVPVETIRSGAFLERNSEVSANGVNSPFYGGQNGGINMEHLQNGIIDHVMGEKGGFSLDDLFNELGGDFENAQTLESFLNGQPQFARNSTGTQGPDLPVEETAENDHDNSEASSGAQSTFDCPQVESVASDPEKENDGGR